MNKLFGFIWRSLLVGAGYAGAQALMRLIFSRGLDAQSLVWSFAGGAVIGFTLGRLASSIPGTWARHMLVWGSIIFLNIASVTIEGRFFAPDLVQGSMVVLLLLQLVVAFVAAWLIVKLFAPIAESTPITPIQRSWFSWLWRFVFCALSYIVFYYFFGAINYLLVTRAYYETHAGGLTVPAAQVVFVVESIRSVLIVFSVFLFLLSIRGTRRQLIISTGWLLFAIGGIVPLILQIGMLPLFLLAASAVEIFFQNFLTGVVAALLMGIEDPEKSKASILVERGVL